MQFKTVWISDVHLGTRGCEAEKLLAFLKKIECEKLYLVGDIIDGWRLKKNGFYWPQAHSNVVRNILTKAKRDTEVIYVVGNHDEFLRQYLEYDLNFGNVEIVDEDIYESNGKSYLVIHGDKFDGVTRYAKWVAILGDMSYTALLHLNIAFNYVRRKLGCRPWSLSSYAKSKVKSAVNFICDFEEALVIEAEHKHFDGVICGHVHSAEVKKIRNTQYMNCGDWVESCSALAENYDGTFSILRWHDE